MDAVGAGMGQKGLGEGHEMVAHQVQMDNGRMAMVLTG